MCTTKGNHIVKLVRGKPCWVSGYLESDPREGKSIVKLVSGKPIINSTELAVLGGTVRQLFACGTRW